MTTEERQPDSEQLKEISIAHLIEEGGHSQLVKRSIYFICGMLFLFVLWGTFTKVDEVAVSFGEVQPVKEIQSIQHLEGGIVAAVYVKNGDEVHAGDPLLKLNPEQIAAELKKAQGKEIALQLDLTRLHAFIDSTPVGLVQWRSAVANSPYNTPDNHEKVEAMIREDIDLLNKQNQERDGQRAIYVEKIQQKKSHLKQYTDSKTELEKKYALNKQEEDMHASLVDEGYVSRRDYIESQRRTIQSVSEIKETEAKLDQAKSELLEAETELQKLDSTLNKEALKETNQLEGQLLEISYTVQRLSALSQRLIISAPENGIVKGLVAQPGSVIAPGDVILDIVPTQGEMVIQCKISTQDIGHVKIGDPAKVKVNAYEFTRYGIVHGKVTEISASTFLTKENLPFYKAKVAIEKTYVGSDSKKNQLKPGMTVQVDIITGKKSVIAYLINPITRGLENAFRER
ncbi:MAG: hypothetical protein A3C44_05570 [Gammaproteobacteria bacterium RIFCSPHIGHO2_02_FULL_39_13]|nr:MAG: hypothetical protein A3C44_05570 [Gammaproteobacteria bacterium RIFCSPHIGHO2_02_FULL_39_13]OGT50498.1 MAG: hypothetical protein A3E53_06820 [Gammaproteobacteria bacterium RIFCSPHIGHO2_12_FULL_39_24]